MNIRTISVLTALVMLAVTSPSLADPGKHKDKSVKPERHAAESTNESGLMSLLISTADQVLIRDYLRTDSQRFCPPGLAKKNNGCLPPGQAKKYKVGQPLPPDLEVFNLPSALVEQLRPPRGHYYAHVDNDVVLISAATKHVVDAVTLLSAVGD